MPESNAGNVKSQMRSDTQRQRNAAEVEEECQRNSLKKRKQQEISY